MMKVIKPQIHTAVFENGKYAHFGIREMFVSLYGYEVKDIIKVKVTIAEDQTIPPLPQNDPKVNEDDYWGWWDNEDNEFSHIYNKYFILDMCFPYGMPAEENKGKGKAYRVNVAKL